MIDEILQNLINIEKMASFINDVIVGTEMEGGYNEVVEEMVRRLAENNLYIKLEICKQKIKKVEFLGVAIRLERIKMKEEKVKGVLNWLTLKGVKNVQSSQNQ